MPRTSYNAAKKRQSRARKPPSYHERERESSRKRMAIYRAKVRAEKQAQQLKCVLGERDRAAIEARGSGRRHRLLREWFDERGLELDPAAVGDEKALRNSMTKIDLHKIELQVAEFEISIMDNGGDEGGYGSEGDCGEPVKESAKADATDPKAFVGRTGQEVDQWDALLGSIEQVGADPSVPSNFKLDRLVEGDAKPASTEVRETPSDAADTDIPCEGTLDAGQEGGGVDELLAARQDDELPPMDPGCFDADGGGAESFCLEAYSW